MKLSQKLLILNIAGLVGIASSLFVLPGNTPFFLWVAVSAGVLIVFNVAMVIRHSKITPGRTPTASKTTTIIIALGTAIWILDILARVLHR